MKTVIVISSEIMGRGDEELGAQLMGNYLRKLWISPVKPDAIVFYNSGVKLLRTGSRVLDALDGLSSAGVDLIACGTCVGHFQLESCLGIGRISDMQEIVSWQMSADRVVTV